MEEREEDVSKLFWEVELKKLNESLPMERKGILELLAMSNPSYKNIAGEIVFFNKEEVHQFSRWLPKEKLNALRLPIVIVRESSHKKGTYMIDGNELEVEAVNRALGRAPSTNKYLFRPEVLELTRRFPSIVVFGFVL
ncbi:MAG: DUF61 family protein [Candidatus Verstraetearchaeota archaeon]|nr:DUF61 family protein [Candidatus Verstraetearchaeota archaeon]